MIPLLKSIWGDTMKLPNGYGTVYKLSGNRRNPWIARKTIRWEYNEETKKSKQICQSIGYYPTRAKALQALAEYNQSPYDLEMSQATFSEIYELWAKDAYKTGSKSKENNYKSAYKKCEPLYDKKMIELRPAILQDLLDNIPDATYDKTSRVKKLLNQLYKFCIQKDYLRHNFAENLEIKIKCTRDERKPFTSDEIKFLWNNINQNEFIKVVLMLIYSGVRVNELLNLKKTDVNLSEQVFFVKKSKTESGIRTVPIATKVLPFWRSYMDSESDYVITTMNGEPFSYSNFNKHYWTPLMENLGLSHTIHEARHTCITQLIQNGAEMTIVKHIVGHKSVMNLTERVYTHVENKKLVETIDLIP